MNKAAFLDRDGVINRDCGYVYRLQDLELLPGVVEGLQTLQRAGYLLVVVTNQSGIARGLYSESDYDQFTRALRSRLQEHGVELSAVYHCPHLPDAPVLQYRMQCDCRKPRPGMLRQAMKDMNIDPQRSFLVGDKPSDVQAGHAAGVPRCYLIDASSSAEVPPRQVDGVFDSLAACVQVAVAEPGSYANVCA